MTGSDSRRDVPRLLVSVRDANEARMAIEGGVDILDIKEPKNGSLGRADEDTIIEIVKTVRSLEEPVPMSAALGELREWTNSRTVPCLPESLCYVKLGFSGCGGDANWSAAWREVRRRLEDVNANPPGWVAVIYADWQAAQAPPPREVIEAAVEFPCAAVLVDTYQKNGRSLTDVLASEALQQIADAVHQHDLPLALAGSLRAEDLPRLSPLSPQIVAVRSAACADGNRDGPICPRAIQHFRMQLLGLSAAS